MVREHSVISKYSPTIPHTADWQWLCKPQPVPLIQIAGARGSNIDLILKKLGLDLLGISLKDQSKSCSLFCPTQRIPSSRAVSWAKAFKGTGGGCSSLKKGTTLGTRYRPRILRRKSLRMKPYVGIKAFKSSHMCQGIEECTCMRFVGCIFRKGLRRP